MKLTVLGSGTSAPHPSRSSSAYWLETADESLLLDCSASVPFRLAEEHLDWPNLDAIWISHFHLDHCAGLPVFLAATKHLELMKSRTKPLRIFGPTGIRKLMVGFNDLNSFRLFDQPFPIEMVEVDELEKFMILKSIEAVTIRTPHTAESQAIHLRGPDDKALVYSADTGFCKTLGAIANAVDLFILECTFLRNKPIAKHLELAEAVFLIRKASPKRAMLTHFCSEWDAVDFGTELRRFEPMCDVLEAVDGLRVDI